MEDERKTPKEYFIMKVFKALVEFEDMTGVEVLDIKIHRLDIEEIGKKRAVSKPSKYIENWELTLR